MWKLHLFCMLGTLFQPYSLGDPCTSFKFPDLPNSILTAKENATVTLKFLLENWTCTDKPELSITIRKKGNDNKYGDICTIRESRDACRRHPSGSRCGCLPEGGYQLNITVGRTDNTKWLWTAHNEKIADKELTFNIHYPPTIHNVTITPDVNNDTLNIVVPHTPVTVICYWENGNDPSETASLLDRHGVKMENSFYDTSQIRYRFADISCKDAGFIRCEAPRANHNGTARLLVKCAPDIGNITNTTASLGEPFELTFPVRAHTTELAECTLVPLGSKQPVKHFRHANDSTAKDNETGTYFLTGTPPDLLLTVRLRNVTADDIGQWRLELTNDAGKGQLDFNLDRSAEREKTSSFFLDMTLRDIVIFAAVGTVVVGIICIVIVAVCRRKATGRKRFHRRVRGRREDDVVLSVAPFAGKANRQNSSDHYNDIDNLPPPVESLRSRRSEIEDDVMDDSTMRQRADTNTTFQPFRPPSSNFRITRIGRRLMAGISARASRMTYE